MTDTEIKILKKLLKKSPQSISELGIRPTKLAELACSELYCNDIISFAEGNSYKITDLNKALYYVSTHRKQTAKEWFDRILVIATFLLSLYSAFVH